LTALINNIASTWGSYFIVMLVQNTLFLALVLAVLQLIRRCGPVTRFSIAIIGLIKLILPLFLKFDFTSNSLGHTTAMVLDQSIVFATQDLPLSVNLSFFLLLLWGGGFCFYLGRFALSTLRLRRLLQAATPLDFDFDYPVYQSEKLSVPLSIGVFSPRIYVPACWFDLPDVQQHMILHHEAEHIRRKDHLLLLLQTIIQSIYFFHPLVWMLNKQINEIREMICDDVAVSRSRTSPLVYSRLLLQFAQIYVHRHQHAAAFHLLRPKLLNRISYQLEKENHQRKRMGTIWFGLLLILVVPFSWSARWSQKEALFAPSAVQTPENEKPGRPSVVDYDTPPLPAGGFAALQKHLNYPESARAAGMEGRTLLSIQVHSDGHLGQVVVEKSSGDASCDRAAIAAVHAVEWHPAKKGGKPLKVTVRLPFVFNLK
jgi:TonB family protein